jgi:hypothetical protein
MMGGLFAPATPLLTLLELLTTGDRATVWGGNHWYLDPPIVASISTGLVW